MASGATISIRWTLDVIDKGGPAKLLAQDRELRTSLNQTDTAYNRTASTAVSASAKQAEASRGVVAATEKEGRARSGLADTIKRYAAAQREALTMGSRVAAQADTTAGAYSRQAAAAKRLADEEARRSRVSRVKAGAGAEAGVLSSLGGIAGGVGSIAKGGALAILGTATGLTVGGLKRGTEIRAGAAGLAGLTGVDPRTATALAVIAQAEQVQARGLGQAFSTLGKQVTGFQHELATGKPGKTTEAFGQLGISASRAQSLQNNLPALFDLVFQRAQKLPAAQQATVLKTFLGRGATLAGQIELGGPLSKQIGTVREQLGGLDPKKLQDLHETEIRLKEATVGLELSFAQTFGPALISLFNKVAPAIKPIGDVLRTAVTVPLEAAKRILPPVIKGIEEAFGAHKPTPPPGPATNIAPILSSHPAGGVAPILGRSRGPSARELAPGRREELIFGSSDRNAQGAPPIISESASGAPPILAVQKGRPARGILPGEGTVLGKPPSTPTDWQKLGKQIGETLKEIGEAAKKYGGELLAALEPAKPFLENVLLPAAEGFAKGMVLAFKLAIPIIDFFSKRLGAIGEAVKPLKPLFAGLGLVLGPLLAGPLLRSVGGISKLGESSKLLGIVLKPLGGIFKLMAVPLDLAATGIGHFGKSLTGIGGILTKTGSLFGKLPGPLGAVAGGMFKAAGSVSSAAGRGLGGLAKTMSGTVKDAAQSIVKQLRGVGPGAKSAAESIYLKANYGLEGMKTLPRKVGGWLKGVPKAISALAGSAAAAATKVVTAVAGAFEALGAVGAAVGVALVAAMAAAIIQKGGDIVEALAKGVEKKLGIGGGAAKAITGLFGELFQKVLTTGEGVAGYNVGKELGKKKRRGGIVGYGAGGYVDSMVSPGELVVHGGGAWMVPGSRTAADSVYAALPVGAAVLTSDGQQRMAAGATIGEAIATQAPHFRTGGFVSTAYGPPWGGIEGGGTTATGIDLSKSPHVYIVAVDPSVIPLHSKLKISPNPFGYGGSFSAEDTGGAIKGNRIDFYDWKGRSDQNRWGVRHVNVSAGGKGGPIGSAGGTENVTQALSLSRSRVRSGLVPDALQQGIEAGAAGLTAEEIARANRGVRGAEGSPLSKAIAEALGPTSREVKTATETSGGGKAGKLPTGVSIPSGTWNPSRKPIDRWIQPYLSYGASHGWPGVVTSGFRTKAEGERIYASGVRPAARPGTSKHEQANYPGGAVDVTDASALSAVLAKRKGPHLLQWAGSKDPVHFSHPVNGTYREGGVVGRPRYTQSYYRQRFGNSYRGWYLWNTYGVGANRMPEPRGGGVGELDTSLAAYYHVRNGDERALSRIGVSRNAWWDKWTHGDRYRAGGVVGFQAGGHVVSQLSAVAGKAGAFTAVLRSYEESLAGLTINRLNHLVRSFTASARKGGSSAVVQSFQALISAVEGQIGLRISELRDKITKRTGGIERGAASVTRYLAFKGVDPTSQEGLKVEIAADAQQVAARKRSIADAQKALRLAKSTGNRKAIAEATEELTKAQEDLQDAVVKGIEDQRSLIAKAIEDVRNKAQEIVDLAGSSVQYGQNQLTGLDISQRLNRSAETPGGETQKASAIQAELLPVLQGAKRAAENQLEVLKGTSASATELATATLAVQSAGNEIASAMAEAAELVRKAAEQAAEELVERAAHTTSLAQVAGHRKELEERIAGTYEAGGQNRGDFINNTIIPDLKAELGALANQLRVAEAQGNPKLAEQIAEALANKQNGILEATLEANEDIAANTNPNHKVGGQLGFAFGGSETLTDALISVGTGS
jgi:3D (Asp-Asp-Asp) domain-containing protein